jgi:hypothetical protein
MATFASTEGARAPVVDFPARIQTALARIMGCDGGGLDALTYRERGLLARVTRNVSTQDPTGSIRVAVSTLAAALRTCNKTVQRTFNSLREKGWILRDQVKRRSGMQIADTWLTPRTLELLGLARVPSSRAASDNMSGASGISTMSEDSQQIPGPSVPEEGEKTEQPVQQKVPEDLSLLQQVGMKPGAIFKLMGEATRVGHRLGHIVKAAAPLIRAAKFPFGYMRKLIDTDRDWANYTCAATLREQEATQAVEVKVQHDAVQAAIEAAMPVGTMLTNAAGKVIWVRRYEVVYACPVADLDKPESLRSYACVTDLAKMAEAIQAGKLFVFQPKKE